MLYFLKQPPKPSLIKKEKQKTSTQKEPGILCVTCSNLITYPKYKIEINNQHTHTFFNPQGIIFEIGCFSNAWGYVTIGPKSSEFSWFPPYKWQVVLCSICNSHLGWQYSFGHDTFFGFILSQLKKIPL
ncbi:cereblon family protein [Desulfonauticus submarinus]